MSRPHKKHQTVTSITHLLVPAGAIAIAIFGMLAVSIAVILLTGIIFGGNQSLDIKHSPKKKNAGIVIISYSKPVEDQIKKSNLATPELPLKARYQQPYSLLNFKFSYRY